MYITGLSQYSGTSVVKPGSSLHCTSLQPESANIDIMIIGSKNNFVLELLVFLVLLVLLVLGLLVPYVPPPPNS